MFRAISCNEFKVVIKTHRGDTNMDYKAMRDRIEDIVNDNHRDFVKAIIT